MTSDVTQPHHGSERTSAGAVVIPKPGLPIDLLARRPELAGIGIGTQLVERVTSC